MKKTMEQKIGYKLTDAQFNMICQKCNIYSTEKMISNLKTRPGELAKYAQMIMRQN
jgi:hypothetical protein